MMKMDRLIEIRKRREEKKKRMEEKNGGRWKKEHESMEAEGGEES